MNTLLPHPGSASAGLSPVRRLAAMILLTLTVHGQPVTLKNPTPAANDQFGRAVAVLGTDRLLVGAHLDDTTGGDSGSAHLFNTDGTLLTTFANPRASATDYFGCAIAAVGTDRVLVGAYLEDSGVLDSGRAYLFDTNGLLVTTFANPSPGELDFFGWSLAAVGNDRVLISAYLDDAGAKDSGSAHLFDLDGRLLTTFANPTPAANDSFGWALTAAGTNQVLIGAYLDDGVSRDTGAAYLFGTDGVLITTFYSPRPKWGDQFGSAVAAVGTDRVLIGAPREDAGNIDAGAAYLFDLEGRLLATFKNPTPGQGDLFGSAVAGVGSDRLLIGAYLDDAGQQDAGVVHLFHADGRLIETIMNPEPTNWDYFGISLAVTGLGQALVGVPYGDAGGVNTGAAYLINLRSE